MISTRQRGSERVTEAGAERVWRRDEALRLSALEAELQEQFEHKLSEVKLGVRADADKSNKEKSRCAPKCATRTDDG